MKPVVGPGSKRAAASNCRVYVQLHCQGSHPGSSLVLPFLLLSGARVPDRRPGIIFSFGTAVRDTQQKATPIKNPVYQWNQASGDLICFFLIASGSIAWVLSNERMRVMGVGESS